MFNRDAASEAMAILEELETRGRETRQASLGRRLRSRYKAHPELVEVDLEGHAERINEILHDGRRRAFEQEQTA